MVNRKVLFVWLFWIAVLADNSTHSSHQVKCGVPKPKVNRLIVRGDAVADPQDWPWHAVVMHRQARSAPEYACGGTLIHKDYVLTAKHCVLKRGTGNSMSAAAMLVQLGVEELYNPGPHHQQHRVLEIHTFEDQADSELKHDIAILSLQTSARFNDHVLPACLVDRQVTPGEIGIVIGFGFTENDTLSSVLKMATMPVIETGRCLRADRDGFGELLDEGLFCAGFQNGTTVCNGDSGGGFYVKTTDDVWYLAGIVSFSLESSSKLNQCRQDNYGAFTRVWKYLEWIRQTTGLNANQFEDTILPPNCGLTTEASETPWAAVLYLWQALDGNWLMQRTGAIISERYVIYSFLYSATYRYRILVGNKGNVVDEYLTLWQGHTFRNVLNGKSHQHTVFEDTSMDSTLTLLRLEEPVPFNDLIQPICLPIAAELRVAKPTQFEALDLLWNDTTDSNYMQRIRLVSSRDSARCLADFCGFVADRDICVERSPGTQCIIFKELVTFRHSNTGKHAVWGYTNGEHCYERELLVRKIDHHLDWILENIEP